MLAEPKIQTTWLPSYLTLMSKDRNKPYALILFHYSFYVRLSRNQTRSIVVSHSSLQEMVANNFQSILHNRCLKLA